MPTTEQEIIAQAKENFRDADTPEDFNTLLGALEAFYMGGCAEEADGDVDTYGHFYRVHRWIVWTDSQGFHSVETFDTDDEAEKAFDKYSDEYTELLEEE